MRSNLHGALPLSLLLPLLFSLPLGACQGGSVPVGHERYDFGDGVDVDLGTEPWRERRRMDIDQLDESIRAVSGGIGWERWATDASGVPYVRERYFDTLSDTLGVPDYVNSASEDLTVSLLFEKFLDDAARDVCRRLADREAGDGAAYDGAAVGIFDPVDVSTTDNSSTQISEALANLLLRFHGRRLAPDDPQLTPWRDLYGRLETAVNAAEPPAPRRAWEGVCIALLTHPDFYTY